MASTALKFISITTFYSFTIILLIIQQKKKVIPQIISKCVGKISSTPLAWSTQCHCSTLSETYSTSVQIVHVIIHSKNSLTFPSVNGYDPFFSAFNNKNLYVHARAHRHIYKGVKFNNGLIRSAPTFWQFWLCA